MQKTVRPGASSNKERKGVKKRGKKPLQKRELKGRRDNSISSISRKHPLLFAITAPEIDIQRLVRSATHVAVDKKKVVSTPSSLIDGRLPIKKKKGG